MSLTQVLFQHDALSIEMRDGQYSVKALKPIKYGTLVLLEHVLSGSDLFVMGAITASEPLFTTLWPRESSNQTYKTYQTYEPEDRMKMAKEKFKHNAFSFNGDHVIGDAFSKFNHSCEPNAYMSAADSMSYTLTPSITASIKIYGLWTLHAIREGEEICVDYVNGNPTVHDHHSNHFGFRCSCDADYLAKSSKRTDLYVKLCGAYRDRDEAFIISCMDKWIRTHDGIRIIKAHVIGEKGFFEDADGLIIVTIPDPNPKRSMLKWKQKLQKII